MNELLQKLLETEILTADTKKELEDAINAKHQEAIAETKMETEATVRAELATKWISEKEALVEAMDTMLTAMVTKEVEELKEDIKDFRDLEAEHASRLVTEREAIREEVKGDMKMLIESIDTFLEMQLTREIEELKESIEDARKVEFGRRMFESFVTEYSTSFVDKDGVEKELVETKAMMESTEKELKDVRKEYDGVIRKLKLESLLKDLDGHAREVMETVLQNVPTEKLDSGYQKFIGRVLKESTTSEKEKTVLAEGKKVPEKVVTKMDAKNVVLETGNTAVEPADKKAALTESSELQIWKRLAGLK